jgi:hypothetical protein
LPLCGASVNDQVFLQDLINCKGGICEGIWEEGNDNIGLDYNECDNSVTISSIGGCGTFILQSDGLGNNPQCGAFKITINICTDCYDWGDLPDSSATTNILDYQTDSLNSGPSHLIIGGLYLGNGVDEENNGQQSTNALGDGADEDGLNFPTHMQIVSGGTLNIPFSATNTTGLPAHVEMWIDWNGDGDFDDAGEMVTDINDTVGFPDYLPVSIPSNAVEGQDIGVRLRLSNTDNMTPYGTANSGLFIQAVVNSSN